MRLVLPNLGWTLLGLFGGSLLLWRLAPVQRRRIRFTWALCALAATLWLIATFLAPQQWVAETVTALVQVVALHIAVVVLFYVFLKRLRIPQILIELTIGAGYIAILFLLLTRVGVNLTGLIATSAVLTAVIGFGLQDLLSNL